MTVDEVVNIFCECGYKIKKINGCYFLSRGLVNYSFPRLEDIPFDKNLLDSLKWKYLVSVIKTQSRIKNTSEFVLETNNYGIEKFATKKRNDIRRSLRDCIFRRPPLEDLLDFGLKINQEALSKQNRRDKFLTDRQCWRKYITSLYHQESILILGAYISDKMVGYITVNRLAGNYYIIDPFYDHKASASAPVKGLIFTLVNQIIKDKGSIRISYGLDSFNPLPSLNKYKHSMLFERKPATRAFVINPLLMPFLKGIVFLYIRVLKYKNIKNPFIRKVIQLYQGTRILSKTKQRLPGNNGLVSK